LSGLNRELIFKPIEIINYGCSLSLIT